MQQDCRYVLFDEFSFLKLLEAVYVNTEMTDDEMVKVIDFSTDFYFQNDGENALKEYMYRKSQIEQKSPVEGEEVYVDNVHLSDEGGQRFMELIHHSLEAAKFDNKKRKVLGSQLLKLKDWNTFRVQEFGMFGDHIRHRWRKTRHFIADFILF